MDDGGGEGARSRGEATGSTGGGGGGGGGEGYSSPGNAGVWQTHGAHTVQIGG